ncbi:glutamate-1-semialdehyde 2,1-aminomutase [Demequina capsici]|uniref:Glutamate-1-semialdehyde 2,1-aminomutase n=1 Tax=Demequina capsici TaxID=3075620 RepID=A0AA96JGU7_9MICO|nr:MULTISPECIES: glutamate-1-semialdehyde 2,1-aminomutase [unclassified Demequina]WNM25438.1 glutamate-1-semialdehyde 2,1-aminomutase [Demequina sp. OYTSA14]WNM28319.1 glutamate-1-semialdehyde 2,1-aminomutase [Demequina sp. PMTSA13]
MRPVSSTLRTKMQRLGLRTLRGEQAWAERAADILPGGVNSPVRAWNGVGGHPLPIASAAGAVITDGAGRDYLDLVDSWGAGIVGHAHPAVVSAVRAAASNGLSFGATTEAEVELAEEIRDRYEPAQKVRLVSTGTEATMTALRIARAATGRDVIVKFAGLYHGHSDALLVAAGSGLATSGVPDSAGVTKAVAADTMVLPYGDVDALTDAFAEHGSRIAAVITEAVPANMGVIAPPAGFHRLISDLCRNEGAVFIVDEVLSGFRAGPAGGWGLERDADIAAGREPWAPDLVTFGKVIGGGLPVAAVAGRADLMDLLAPLGAVYQAGTLSGNPVAVAAGLATMRLLDDDAYAHLTRVSTMMRRGVSAELASHGITHAVGHAGTLFSVFLGLEEAPVTFDDVSRQDALAYSDMFHSLRGSGIALPPSAYEAWFVSLAHTDEHVGKVVDAIIAWGGREAKQP